MSMFLGTGEYPYTPAGTNDDWRGSYLGFTYNGIHSTELGIVRVSSGSRYDDGLLPTIQDKAVQVPGGDGTYLFGSYYTQRQFTIQFAFDALSDVQLRRLRAVFGDKQVHPLIFDETPYKYYMAKVTGNATAKHLAFDAPGGKRIFKGEGTLQFTCYFPFARSRFKYLNEYYPGNIPEWRDEDDNNTEEWREGSGIREYDSTYDVLQVGGVIPSELPQDEGFGVFIANEENVIPPAEVDDPYIVRETGAEITEQEAGALYLAAAGYWDEEHQVMLEMDIANGAIGASSALLNTEGATYTGYKYYNAGDIETDWKLYIPASEIVKGGTLGLLKEGEEIASEVLTIRQFRTGEINPQDEFVIVDTKTNLLIGSNTGTVYNRAVESGTFFKLPVGEGALVINGFGAYDTIPWESAHLEYDYLYF